MIKLIGNTPLHFISWNRNANLCFLPLLTGEFLSLAFYCFHSNKNICYNNYSINNMIIINLN